MKAFSVLIFLLLTASFAQAQEGTDSVRLHKYYQQANQYISSYQFDKALSELSKCYIADPQNINYLLKIAYCHSQSGRYPDAKLFYNEVLKMDSLNLLTISSLGSMYEGEKNYTKAQEYYQDLIRIDTTNSYYYKRNGYISLRLSDPNSAADYFLKAHELNKIDIDVIHQLGKIYLALELFDFAEQMIWKGLDTDPNNIKLLQTKARIHHKRKEHVEVTESIEKIMIQGDTTDYYQMMLGVSYIHLDSLDTAIYHLERIIDREKDSEHTHHYLGLAYQTKEEMEKAENHFLLAIEKGISPQIGEYYDGLATIMKKQNKLREAIRYFEKALEFGARGESIFQLAHTCDLYYKDKKIALRYYQQYLNSSNEKYREHAEVRIVQLKEILHFQN
ncbi:MAG: hypothetical protein GY705_02095 [Bacteroidetes bacterium]|nr:hypothetical protein [Bacteroidota bacterium]